MPYKRKDSPFWWISWVDASGRKRSGSAKTTDYKTAKTLEHERRAEAARVANPSADKTFDDVMLAFIQENPSERRSYAVAAMMPYFSGKCLSDIKAIDIAKYKSGRSVSVGTLARELGVLSAAINWVKKEYDWDVPNPVSGRKPATPPHRLRWLSREEFGRLVSAVNPKAPYLVDFLHLAVNTGMRKGEMLLLTWPRVDLAENLVYLRPIDQKVKQYDSVPLNRDAREVLLRRARFRAENCPGSPWAFCREDGSQIKAVKRSFATACRTAGIEDFHIHDLRHTCAAWLVQAGIPLRTVADVLRHKDITTTMKYAHLAPENARAGVEALETERRTSVVADFKKRQT